MDKENEVTIVICKIHLHKPDFKAKSRRDFASKCDIEESTGRKIKNIALGTAKTAYNMSIKTPAKNLSKERNYFRRIFGSIKKQNPNKSWDFLFLRKTVRIWSKAYLPLVLLTQKLFIMSDDLSKKRPQDATKVNVNEDWELEYWSKKFGVTKDQLKNAVKAVGVSAAAVQKYLGK
ncbi:DUF3606 domain-containing protein [Chryseobacterium sp. NRRL B-14859]|uniref:DUF3606 domain-containing protein n=1 Tax=Chryseobacterium sp. NRRL B-14859 TaxID=1562763 RepID=UPI0033963C74